MNEPYNFEFPLFNEKLFSNRLIQEKIPLINKNEKVIRIESRDRPKTSESGTELRSFKKFGYISREEIHKYLNELFNLNNNSKYKVENTQTGKTEQKSQSKCFNFFLNKSKSIYNIPGHQLVANFANNLLTKKLNESHKPRSQEENRGFSLKKDSLINKKFMLQIGLLNQDQNPKNDKFINLEFNNKFYKHKYPIKSCYNPSNDKPHIIFRKVSLEGRDLKKKNELKNKTNSLLIPSSSRNKSALGINNLNKVGKNTFISKISTMYEIANRKNNL